MGLLRADLQALANLPATPAGRRVVAGTVLVLGLFAITSWWLAGTMLDHLGMIVPAGDGDRLRQLLAHGLTPCPMAATWLGLVLAQRQLFEAPELPLWRAAPVPGWRAAMQVLLRACFLTCCWAAALAGPFLLAVLQRSTAPAWAYVLVPLAGIACTVPLLCTLLAVQIALVRWFAGRVLRLVFTVVAASASVGFMAWLLLGLFTPSNRRVAELTATTEPDENLPWTIDAAATLLANAARGVLHVPSLLGALAWIAGAVLAFAAAARLHPAVVERHQEATPSLLRPRARAWPSSLAATIRKKEIAQVVQQPGAIVGFLVFAVLVWLLAEKRLLVGGFLANRNLPREATHLAAMLFHWFLTVLLVLYAHMGRLALWDGSQWSLYMASPAPPRTILRGKLAAIGIFLAWPLVLVGVTGAQILGAGSTTLLAFAGIAAGGTLAALGVLAVVGTWPRLMRPDDGGQILHGGRSFVAALLLVVMFELALLLPGSAAWWWLETRARARAVSVEEVTAWLPAAVGGALTFGALVASLGVWIGGRNYRRLLQPR